MYKTFVIELLKDGNLLRYNPVPEVCSSRYFIDNIEHTQQCQSFDKVFLN